MPFDLLAVYLNLPVFAMVASRLGGLIMFQPVLNSLSIPLNLRVMFVLALAALVTPLVTNTSLSSIFPVVTIAATTLGPTGSATSMDHMSASLG